MKTIKELLKAYYKAYEERNTARNDWEAADAKIIAATAARQEAADRWIIAGRKRTEAYESIGETL